MRNTMRSRGLLSASVLTLFVLGASTGFGEAQGAAETKRGWTGISFTGGVSSGSSDTGVALGGTFTYELTPRLALEATGTYLDRGSGADAFDLSASLLVGLVPSGRDVVPYFAAGGGLYRASFDLSDPRFLGTVPTQFGPGTTLCTGSGPAGPAGFGPAPGAGSGTCLSGQLPQFYGQRLGGMAVPTSGVLATRSYTDPAFNFGGGVRIDVSPHVFLRPDARVLVVVGEGDTYSVGVFTIKVGYRF